MPCWPYALAPGVPAALVLYIFVFGIAYFWSYNSHSVQFTYLKSTIQWFLGCVLSYAAIFTVSFRTFPPPPPLCNIFIPIGTQLLLTIPAPQPLATTDLLSVSYRNL